MNIFYLSANPKEAAEFHLDKHVIKMIIESAQLLCTAHRILDGNLTTVQIITKAGKKRTVKRYMFDDIQKDQSLYKSSHIHHPCCVWARTSINNYMWLYELFVALCDEYTFRYGKKHKTDLLLRDILKSPPKNIDRADFTLPPQAMPSEYKHSDPVLAYRNYYNGAKAKFAKWTNRPIPTWFSDSNKIGGSDANV